MAVSALVAACCAGVTAGCGTGGQPAVPGASAKTGKTLIAHYGCGACHQIGGVTGANGQVGPSLKNFKKALPFIVGKFPNTPQNVARWIQHPQQILPQGIMPDLGVTPQQALDIAAYLETQ